MVVPVSEPVLIASVLAPIYLGKASPTKMAKPKTNKLRLDSSDTFFRLERPTPVIMANMTQKRPPTTGSGMVTKIDENLPQHEKQTSNTPATCITMREATRVIAFETTVGDKIEV